MLYTGRMIAIPLWGRRERILAGLIVGIAVHIAVMWVYLPRI